MTPALKAMVEAMIAEAIRQANDQPWTAADKRGEGCVCIEREERGVIMLDVQAVGRAGLEAIKGFHADVLNAMIPEVEKAAVEFVRRERAGRSASMNGALEYTEFAAWKAGIDAILKEQP